MKNYLLCCDWGTSSFRLRLVDVRDCKILAEIQSDEGISSTFQSWKDQNEHESRRFNFYLERLKTQIGNLAKSSSVTLENIPVIISGMASSTIGMEEIPYASIPFALDGSSASIRTFEIEVDFHHRLTLVSGVRSREDVMRGEEAQIIGLFNLQELKLQDTRQSVFIFPGTHSKHIYVKNKIIADFQTFMTGELFNLLSERSILKDSIDSRNSSGLTNPLNADAFKLGVEVSGSLPILHSLFTVRTNQLFDKLAKEQNFFYLSGLLIGTELRSLLQKNTGSLVICSGNNLYDHYKLAVEEIGLTKDTTFVPPHLIDKATIAGQVKIFKEINRVIGER